MYYKNKNGKVVDVNDLTPIAAVMTIHGANIPLAELGFAASNAASIEELISSGKLTRAMCDMARATRMPLPAVRRVVKDRAFELGVKDPQYGPYYTIAWLDKPYRYGELKNTYDVLGLAGRYGFCKDFDSWIKAYEPVIHEASVRELISGYHVGAAVENLHDQSGMPYAACVEAVAVFSDSV